MFFLLHLKNLADPVKEIAGCSSVPIEKGSQEQMKESAVNVPLSVMLLTALKSQIAVIGHAKEIS